MNYRDFENRLKSLEDDIQKQIGLEIPLGAKLPQLEKLIFIYHAALSPRASEEYLNLSEQWIIALKRNFVLVGDEEISLSYNQNPTTQKNRYDLLIEWYSRLLRENPNYALYRNLRRVEF
jgi:hypothetical protein